MPIEELRGWLSLIRCPGLGTRTLIELIDAAGSAAAVLAGGHGLWRRHRVSAESCAALDSPDTALIESDMAWCSGQCRALIVWTDPRYPKRLREIAHAPPALFCRGDVDLLSLPQIAIVGSRNATPQGLETAGAFAAELARRGLAVTSGLALGVDGAAHRGALSVRGLTLAVCATGLDRVYPARHRELAGEIERHGLLISEFAPGTAPRAEHFPQRNRLISGLALGVLVVEAARESGSLITARLAAEQGREVFAIPGSIHNVMSRGCHQLIRQGAKLVENVDDILEELGGAVGDWLRAGRAPVASAAPEAATTVAHRHQRVLDALGDSPKSVDELVERLGQGVDAISTALLELELEGRVGPAAGGRSMRLGMNNS